MIVDGGQWMVERPVWRSGRRLRLPVLQFPPMSGTDTLTSTTEIEVRYAETDQMGVVHHANYLVWFELARTDYCRKRGLRYTEIERRGYLLMVVGAELKYRHPVRYGDTVSVACSIDRHGSRGLTFHYGVQVDGRMAATGYTNHIWVAANGRRPVTVPDFARPYFDEDSGR